MKKPVADHHYHYPDPERRQLLRFIGMGAIGGALGNIGGVAEADQNRLHRRANSTTKPGADSDRILVVIELNGGNDGLNTLVPYGHGNYYDARKALGIQPDAVIPFDGSFGLNAALAGLHQRGLSVMQGIGTTTSPNLSHFQMQDRWYRGDIDGTYTGETGFLGRCCDAVKGDSVVTGLSLEYTQSPIIVAKQARTATLGSLEGATALFAKENALLPDGIAAIHKARTEQLSSLFGTAREAMRDMVILSNFLRGVAAPSKGYPDTTLGEKLAVVSRIIRTNGGVRVFHVPYGDFDTHTSQGNKHTPLLKQLNDATSVFLDDMQASGYGDKVLIATISEFGRRVQENDSGTDHGNGSVAMMAGPVIAGLHGEAPSLRNLDADGNLKPTTSYGDYYATLAAWLGVSDIVLGSPLPLLASATQANS